MQEIPLAGQRAREGLHMKDTVSKAKLTLWGNWKVLSYNSRRVE